MPPIISLLFREHKNNMIIFFYFFSKFLVVQFETFHDSGPGNVFASPSKPILRLLPREVAAGRGAPSPLELKSDLEKRYLNFHSF